MLVHHSGKYNMMFHLFSAGGMNDKIEGIRFHISFNDNVLVNLILPVRSLWNRLEMNLCSKVAGDRAKLSSRKSVHTLLEPIMDIFTS